MSELIGKLFALHDALSAAGLAHAFGGAIALAYCTEEPRGTRDLDVNIFTDSSNAERALGALPDEVAVTPASVEAVARDGQDRLWWDDTPIDVFLNNHPFHEAVAEGVVWVPLAGRDVPVLDCASLVVFKALFARTKDWADIEAVAERDPGQVEAAAVTVEELLGKDDAAYARLASLVIPG
ncbi:MAG: hypothetical protein FVQ78_01965 [Solirubrobacterales bacterium]|nr:hypothetical protein [Solirubrobacterales bacterium]